MQRITPQLYFMLMAKVASLRSTCNSRPTGAVIVKDKRIIATGYNGSLPGKDQCSDKGKDYCYRRDVNGPEEDKYNICISIHGEMNALMQAAKYGISVEGCDMYCTLSPCYVCLKSIVSAGIKTIYYETLYASNDKERDNVWNDFKKVGIEAHQIEFFAEDFNNKYIQYILGKLKGNTSARQL